MTELTTIEMVIMVIVLIIVSVVGVIFLNLVHFLIYWYMMRKTEEINDIINNINKEKDI